MIKVMEAGFYTTIQDQGRFGFRHLGVPTSGPMDSQAFRLANALLPLKDEQTVFECTLTGPILEINAPLRFVATGANVPIDLDGQPCAMNQVHFAPKGSRLKFGKISTGVRFYLRFEAIFDLPKYFDSVSFYPALGSPSRLEKGDELSIVSFPNHTKVAHAKVNIAQDYLRLSKLDVQPGTDWERLTTAQQKQLMEETHKVLAQNRMGYRLSSTIVVTAPQLLSQLILPGMVQLTPSGEILIATADCQVSGGYLQVLCLSEEALAVLVQKREGEQLTFRNTLPQKQP